MLRKQLFYLTNEQLWAYQWQHGQLSAGHCFPSDEAGLEAFAAYLESRANTPAYLVADLVEEDFQRHLLPHVRGAAGRALVARRLAQQYRDTPYRYAALQNREADGRRDDHALFCALTNPAALQSWVESLGRASIPLAGIYSATLLSAMLAARLRLADRHVLLVTRQAAGLRQSYLLDGRLKFSRLTPAADIDGLPASLAAETGKAQQFLTSTRLLARGDVLHAYVLCRPEQSAALAGHCRDNSELNYHFLDSAEAARRHGTAPDAATEQLLLAGLGRHAAPSHYALGAAGRFYRLWQARLALYGASAATLAGAVLWLGANLWGSYAAHADAAALDAETQRLAARNGAIAATLPAAAEPASNMRAAVLLERAVAARGPMPAPLLALVSQALERVPAVQLSELDWQVRLPAGAAADKGQAARAPAMPVLLLGLPGAPAQALRIEAEVTLAPHDERNVLDSMNQFAGELARDPHLQVAIETPALDVRSSAKLAGKAGPADADSHAKFTLKLLWTP